MAFITSLKRLEDLLRAHLVTICIPGSRSQVPVKVREFFFYVQNGVKIFIPPFVSLLIKLCVQTRSKNCSLNLWPGFCVFPPPVLELNACRIDFTRVMNMCVCVCVCVCVCACSPYGAGFGRGMGEGVVVRDFQFRIRTVGRLSTLAGFPPILQCTFTRCLCTRRRNCFVYWCAVIGPSRGVS